MADIISTKSGTLVDTHTLQRYRSILHDYANDFKKMKAIYQSNKNKLSIFSESSMRYLNLIQKFLHSSAKPRAEILLKEKASITSSLAAADDVLEY